MVAIAAAQLPATEESLRADLLRRFREDQDARKAMIAVMERIGQDDPAKLKAMTDVPEVKKLAEIDRANTLAMKEIIARHGWPGEGLVGKDGAHAAWLLVQHADQDRPFQKQCLALIEAAVRRKDASGSDLAYLTDRVLMGEGKPQRYGTQIARKDGRWVPQAIEDETNVDKRRAEVGLSSLAEYLKQCEDAMRP